MDTNPLDDTVLARRSKRRRALLAILLGASLAMLGAGAMSLAVFTDTGATSGAWSTGTIVLGVSPSTTFGPVHMMPGDTGSQTVTVANTGTGALRYAMDGVATDLDAKGLAAQLDLMISAGTCAAPGAQLYAGSLAGAALGSNAQGNQAGDRIVAAGATDDLCFAWELPFATTGNGFQDAATGAVFTFDAEQTAHN